MTPQTLGERFTASLKQRFHAEIITNRWPTITNYNAYMTEVLRLQSVGRFGKIENEGHVWWIITHDESNANDWWTIDADKRREVRNLAQIIRKAVFDKYENITEYADRKASPIGRRFALRFFAGGSLPRGKTMIAIARDLGFKDFYELIRVTLDRTKGD